MPIYEFRCLECNRKFTDLLPSSAAAPAAQCPNCGSRQVQKLVSRFIRGKNEEQRIDEVSERIENMGDTDSGVEMRSMVREMGKALDEDLSDDIEEVYEMDMEGKLGDDD